MAHRIDNCEIWMRDGDPYPPFKDGYLVLDGYAIVALEKLPEFIESKRLEWELREYRKQWQERFLDDAPGPEGILPE